MIVHIPDEGFLATLAQTCRQSKNRQQLGDEESKQQKDLKWTLVGEASPTDFQFGILLPLGRYWEMRQYCGSS